MLGGGGGLAAGAATAGAAAYVGYAAVQSVMYTFSKKLSDEFADEMSNKGAWDRVVTSVLKPGAAIGTFQRLLFDKDTWKGFSQQLFGTDKKSAAQQVKEVEEAVKKVKRTKPVLHTKGTAKIVDYTEYGTFQKVGTEKYFYRMHDPEGLAAAVGEGIYPNNGAVYNNPRYKIVKSEGRLEGNHWDFVNSDDLEASYFKWFTAKEPWGVRLFYIGMILIERCSFFIEIFKGLSGSSRNTSGVHIGKPFFQFIKRKVQVDNWS